MDANGTKGPLDLEVTRQELAEVRERMAQMHKEATAAVEANWTSQWRNPAVVAIKVDSRLTGIEEYRALVAKARAAEAAIAAAEAGG